MSGALSKRIVENRVENARPLAAFFNDAKLRQITPAQVAAYQECAYRCWPRVEDRQR
jgi:hypothetical protein